MILVKTIAGSHLFGLNTESSDKDYKGIYLPTKREILLGNYSDTRQIKTNKSNTRNNKEDIDVELYSLRKFFKMLELGDTAALELLFTPKEMVVEKHLLWNYILRHRNQLLSKNIKSLIGYSRHQANKYGIKGSRLNSLEIAMNTFKEVEKHGPSARKLKTNWEELMEKLIGIDYISFEILSNDTPAICILGKYYECHASFEYVNKALKDAWKERGQRAREAKDNKGVDFKALSHALRVTYQGIELLETGNITLPHCGENLKTLMEVKLGKLSFNQVSDILDETFIKLENAHKSSSLNDKPDIKLMEDLLIEMYQGVIENDL